MVMVIDCIIQSVIWYVSSVTKIAIIEHLLKGTVQNNKLCYHLHSIVWFESNLYDFFSYMGYKSWFIRVLLVIWKLNSWILFSSQFSYEKDVRVVIALWLPLSLSLSACNDLGLYIPVFDGQSSAVLGGTAHSSPQQLRRQFENLTSAKHALLHTYIWQLSQSSAVSQNERFLSASETGSFMSEYIIKPACRQFTQSGLVTWWNYETSCGKLAKWFGWLWCAREQTTCFDMRCDRWLFIINRSIHFYLKSTKKKHFGQTVAQKSIWTLKSHLKYSDLSAF